LAVLSPISFRKEMGRRAAQAHKRCITSGAGRSVLRPYGTENGGSPRTSRLPVRHNNDVAQSATAHTDGRTRRRECGEARLPARNAPLQKTACNIARRLI
jgi:hypothetical protein